MHTGKPLDFHQNGFMSSEQWSLYQGGMRSIAGISAKEVVRKIPVPQNARDLLDIGGSHGFYSVGLCKRNNNLRAVILELPEAIEAARPLLEKENMGDRIKYRPGDATKDDLGSGAWDVVFISNLVHHFDLATNRDITKRIFESLRPGGTFTILESIRPHSPEAAQKARLGALLDFFFAVTSQSGTWTIEEMAGWQKDAGFIPQKPKWLRSMPGYAQISAQKKV
jgi:SAM-dependent methyltransferase